jgi:hypothetical protein
MLNLSMESERPQIIVLPSTAVHVRALAANLRPADQNEIEIYGFPTNKALWRSFKASFLRHTAFIDNEIAAMWGVGGSPMGQMGQPWLMTTEAVKKISPLAFARIYQREVLRMLNVFPVLINYVDAEYTAAVRLLDIVGFNLGEPEPLGKNGALFRQFEMRV